MVNSISLLTNTFFEKSIFVWVFSIILTEKIFDYKDSQHGYAFINL